MDFDVIMALIGLTVAAVASVLGIWIERDEERPPRWAYALSALILMSTGVGMYQSYSDHQDSEKMKDDMARVLETLDKLSQGSGSGCDNPALSEMVKSEIAAQSRANPKVVQKLAQRVADNGEDPSDVLGTYLPSSEVEKLGRSGRLAVKANKAAAPAHSGAATPRRVRVKLGAQAPRPDTSAAAPPHSSAAVPPHSSAAAPPHSSAAAQPDPKDAPKDARSADPKAPPDAKDADKDRKKPHKPGK